MTPEVSLGNMQAMYHFGPKILFDGYLINGSKNGVFGCIRACFLFDGYLIKGGKQ